MAPVDDRQVSFMYLSSLRRLGASAAVLNAAEGVRWRGWPARFHLLAPQRKDALFSDLWRCITRACHGPLR